MAVALAAEKLLITQRLPITDMATGLDNTMLLLVTAAVVDLVLVVEVLLLMLTRVLLALFQPAVAVVLSFMVLTAPLDAPVVSVAEPVVLVLPVVTPTITLIIVIIIPPIISLMLTAEQEVALALVPQVLLPPVLYG